MEEGEANRPRIEFSLEAPEQDPGVLEEERKKHQARAERFGTNYRDPGQRKEYRLEARKERLADTGFVTGIDLFSEEEKAKRAARAAKFGLQQPDPLAYAPDPEEIKKAERGAKFGTGYHADAALMDMDLYEERADAPPDTPRRPDAIYLYGVDVMSTGDIKSYFGDYGPRFVEWINDSSCCVLFADAASALRAIVATGHPLPPEQEAPDAGGQAGLDPNSVESAPYLWHKGKDFVKSGTPVNLMYRMATEADRKDPNAPRRSRYLWKTAAGGGRGGGGGPRSGGRRKRGTYEEEGGGMEGYEEYGPGGGGGGGGEDGDAEMRQQRGERGGKQARRRKKRVKGADGSYRDVEMGEASGSDDGGGGGEGGGGGGGEKEEDGPEAAAKAAAVTEERFGVPDLREVLKQKAAAAAAAGGGGGGRIDALAPGAFDEVVPEEEE